MSLRCPSLAALCGGILLSFASGAHALTPITNIFAGSNGTNPTSVQISNLLGLNLSTEAIIGPGFDTTLTESAAALNTLSAIINQGSNGQMTISETGGVGLANSFSATRTFDGNTLDDFTTYQFTLTRQAGSVLDVLASSSVLITANGAPIATSGMGTGLLSAVDVLSLFGTSNTATFSFTTGDVNNTAPVSINISGGLTASVVNSAFTFSQGSLAAVPEPGAMSWSLAGAAGLVAWRMRRRLAW